MYTILNPFPLLLDLSFFAPFFLRVALGILLITIGYIRLTRRRGEYRMAFIDVWKEYGVILLFALGALELVVGLMFLLGFYTQIAALMGIGISGTALILKNTKTLFGNNKQFYILVFIISLSLLISGAGPFGFDFPL